MPLHETEGSGLAEYQESSKKSRASALTVCGGQNNNSLQHTGETQDTFSYEVTAPFSPKEKYKCFTAQKYGEVINLEGKNSQCPIDPIVLYQGKQVQATCSRARPSRSTLR